MPSRKHDTKTDRRSWYAIGVTFAGVGLGTLLMALVGWSWPIFLCTFASGMGGVIWFFVLMYRYACPACGARLRYHPPPSEGVPITYFCRACDAVWDTGLVTPSFGSSLMTTPLSKLDAQIPSDALMEIHEALFHGRKMDAIKRCRAITGAELAEAVYRIERMEEDLRAATPEKFTTLPKASRGKVFRVLTLLAVLLVIVVILAAVGGLMALLLGAVSNKTK
ncbi:MAG: hypothetical protein EB141_20425 [Verrucomicrobia bacterium]|nr:hypothetical protein [Verrucomicrobiota bacterium]NBU11395.1 hypothetical protein [Pseudomonadota bacterium]NDA68910.1 hypothetical protein [Verrucomicrobiota bacterium]NDB77980.1 hypothetical protein [Verrucomicrobiota bacterium]NDD40627.1 hypothetical protein [Verrucomicrobiota bacterium]